MAINGGLVQRTVIYWFLSKGYDNRVHHHSGEGWNDRGGIADLIGPLLGIAARIAGITELLSISTLPYINQSADEPMLSDSIRQEFPKK